MFISSYVLHNNKCKGNDAEHPNIYSENNAKMLGMLHCDCCCIFAGIQGMLLRTISTNIIYT